TSEGMSQERRRPTRGRCGASAGCTERAYCEAAEKPPTRWDFAKSAVILGLEMADSAPEPTTSRSPRVLVVDDEQSIVDFIRLGLQYEGFLVQTAPDRQAALRLISELRPHVVVLDIT